MAIFARLVVSYGYDVSNATALGVAITKPDLSVQELQTSDLTVGTTDRYTSAGLKKANTYVTYLMQQSDFTLSGLYTVRVSYSGPPPPAESGPFYPTESCNATFTL